VLVVIWWLMTALAGSPTALAGTWTFTGGNAQIEAAAASKEAVAQTFNFAVRPIVRSRLNKPMTVDTGIRIEASEDAVAMHWQGDNPRTVRLTAKDGRFIDDAGTLTLTAEGDVWVLKGVSDEGGLVRRFEVSGDKLTLVSHIFSPQLTTEPSWTLSYAK
jgi:hypothetical protein